MLVRVALGMRAVRGTLDVHSRARLTATRTSSAGQTRAEVKADTVAIGKETMYVQIAPPKHASSNVTSSSRQLCVPPRVAAVECIDVSAVKAIDATPITVKTKRAVYASNEAGLLAVCDAIPREVRMRVTLVASPKPRCERRPP